jgi:peptide/nickel transport system permease protein
MAQGDTLTDPRIRQPRQRRGWQRFVANKLSVVGALVLLALVLFSVVGPLIGKAFGLEPYAIASDCLGMDPPSRAHPLGCDPLGRDILARLMVGGRISLFVGLMVAVITTVLGLTIGLPAGYFGGLTDNLLMRFTDTMLALPTFFLLLAAAALLGPNLLNTVLIIGATRWMTTARLVRAETLVLREKEFVTASRALGAKDLHLTFRILPHVMPTVIVVATLTVASGILTESALSFLGLGTQPPQSSWGYMLSAAQTYIWVNPMMSVYPGLLIMLTVLAVNFVGDGLRDALDPRLGER